MSNLVKYNAARFALSEAVKIDEVKDMRDKAEAMAAYARQAKDTEMVEWATEIKVRAERKAGQMLADMEMNKGAATRSHDSTALPKTLSELDISKNESSRWQKLALVNDSQFEDAIAAAKEVAGQVTTAAMLRAAKSNEVPTPKPEKEVEIDYDALDAPDFVQIASDLEKERDAALDLVKRFEGTDVEKAVNDFDGLANRLACETRDHNELKRKYKFQSDLLKEIRLAVGVESNFDIVAKVKKP